MRTSIIAALAAIGLLSVVGAPLHAQDATLTGAAAYGDFSKDAPGVWRKITVADLPNPGASPGAAFSKIVERPSDSQPHVLPGFTITAMATGLMRPRIMRFASNGDMFVGEVGLPKPAGSGPRHAS